MEEGIMNALDVLQAMRDQYDKDVVDRTVYGPELVSSDQLLGERRMIITVEKLLEKEITEMGLEYDRKRKENI